MHEAERRTTGVDTHTDTQPSRAAREGDSEKENERKMDGIPSSEQFRNVYIPMHTISLGIFKFFHSFSSGCFLSPKMS